MGETYWQDLEQQPGALGSTTCDAGPDNYTVNTYNCQIQNVLVSFRFKREVWDSHTEVLHCKRGRERLGQALSGMLRERASCWSGIWADSDTIVGIPAEPGPLADSKL